MEGPLAWGLFPWAQEGGKAIRCCCLYGIEISAAVRPPNLAMNPGLLSDL